MTQLGYFLEKTDSEPLAKLAFGDTIPNLAGSRFVSWDTDSERAVRTLFEPWPGVLVEGVSGELAPSRYLAGYKIGPGLETCHLTLGPQDAKNSDGQRDAIWHPCPVDPVQVEFADTSRRLHQKRPLLAGEPVRIHLKIAQDQETWYLAADGAKAVFVTDKTKACDIRSTRNQLCLCVDLSRRELTHWEYRHANAQTWVEPQGPDDPLPAHPGDELNFILRIKESDVSASLIEKVELTTQRITGPERPWSPLDLVLAGNAATDSVFSTDGTRRTPAGPFSNPNYYYAWGDVVELNREGRWKITATVRIAGQDFTANPQMCVGTHCGSGPGEECYS